MILDGKGLFLFSMVILYYCRVESVLNVDIRLDNLLLLLVGTHENHIGFAWETTPEQYGEGEKELHDHLAVMAEAGSQARNLFALLETLEEVKAQQARIFSRDFFQ
jgi:hypothetical protein